MGPSATGSDRGGRERVVDAISNLPWVVNSRSDDDGELVERICAAAGVRPDIAHKVDSLELSDGRRRSKARRRLHRWPTARPSAQPTLVRIQHLPPRNASHHLREHRVTWDYPGARISCQIGSHQTWRISRGRWVARMAR
jgi:hypothetical protein